MANKFEVGDIVLWPLIQEAIAQIIYSDDHKLKLKINDSSNEYTFYTYDYNYRSLKLVTGVFRKRGGVYGKLEIMLSLFAKR